MGSQMFNLDFSELLILAAIALICIDPKRLPEVARMVARLIYELRRMTGDFGSTFSDIQRSYDDVVRKSTEDIQKALLEPAKRDPGTAKSEPLKPEHSSPSSDNSQPPTKQDENKS